MLEQLIFALKVYFVGSKLPYLYSTYILACDFNRSALRGASKYSCVFSTKLKLLADCASQLKCPVIIGVCIDDKKWSRKDVTCHVHFSLYLFLWHLGSSCRNFGQTWLPTAKHRVIYALYHYRALSHLVTFP